jgi:hypothetical protein
MRPSDVADVGAMIGVAAWVLEYLERPQPVIRVPTPADIGRGWDRWLRR